MHLIVHPVPQEQLLVRRQSHRGAIVRHECHSLLRPLLPLAGAGDLFPQTAGGRRRQGRHLGIVGGEGRPFRRLADHVLALAEPSEVEDQDRRPTPINTRPCQNIPIEGLSRSMRPPSDAGGGQFSGTGGCDEWVTSAWAQTGRGTRRPTTAGWLHDSTELGAKEPAVDWTAWPVPARPGPDAGSADAGRLTGRSHLID